MYIRRTQTRNTATGETYYTHRLVQSVRVGSQVRQATRLNLGRQFALPQAHWPALCARPEELLGGQGMLPVGGSLLVKREAQRLVAQLLVRQPAYGRGEGGGAVGLWAMAQVNFPQASG